jgi:hypothetical protein
VSFPAHICIVYVLSSVRNAIDTCTSKAPYNLIPQIGILGLKICCHVGSVNPESEFSSAHLCIDIMLNVRNAIDTCTSKAPYILIPQIGILGLKICCHVGSVNEKVSFPVRTLVLFRFVYVRNAIDTGPPIGVLFLIPQIGILGLKICCHVGSVNPESEFSSAFPIVFLYIYYGAMQ